MRKITYLAVFQQSEKGYNVFFPDLPECICCGNSFENAQQSAAEILGLYLYGMEKECANIPSPSKVSSINFNTMEGHLVSPISVFPDVVKDELNNKRIKTTITIPAWLKEAAEKNGVNYSRVLETALIDYLNLPRPGAMQNEGRI